MTEIVKVQKPLATNDAAQVDMALIYAEGRKWMVQQRLDAATNAAMANDVKAFFEADYRPSTDRWTIGRRVKDRNW